MFIVSLDPGVHPFVQDAIKVNQRALIALFTKAGRLAPVVAVTSSPAVLAPPPATSYEFRRAAAGSPLFNVEVGGKFVQIRGATVTPAVVTLITPQPLLFEKDDGSLASADGLTITALRGFALSSGIAGGAPGLPDFGVLRNRHLFAHELGHVLGYVGDRNGHSSAAGNVMYSDGVSDRPDVVADNEYLDLVTAWLGQFPAPPIG